MKGTHDPNRSLRRTRKRLMVSVFGAVLSGTLLLSGCGQLSEITDSLNSDLRELENSLVSELSSLTNPESEAEDSSKAPSSYETDPSAEPSEESDSLRADVTYTMADVYQLSHTDYFADGTLEHIFDGTINKKGKATGYHYTMIADSKGEIIEGTRSRTDKNGVFTGKVKVDGVKKDGFSSFYPESWTPQQVVDAINEAYEEARANSDNPSGSLWIGHCGDLEIDMYLNNDGKITTAFPIFEEG